MSEVSGSVPNPINANVTTPIELSYQRSDQPITCTAHALVNGLRMRGATVTSSEDRSLVQQTLDQKAPLSPEDTIKPFALAHGYTLEQWRLGADKITTPESVAVQFAAQLEIAGPAMLSISGLLSRRNRSIGQSVSFDDNPTLSKRFDAHRVVAIRKGNTVQIIDSYDPQHPEEFDIENPSEQKRLALWLTSVSIQDNLRIADPSLQLDRALLLQRGVSWLDNKVKDPVVIANGMLRTSVESFMPVSS